MNKNYPQPWSAQVIPLHKLGLTKHQIAIRLNVQVSQVIRILNGNMRVLKKDKK